MVELLLKMMYVGATISEMPMLLDTSRRRGKSKMKLFKTAGLPRSVVDQRPVEGGTGTGLVSRGRCCVAGSGRAFGFETA